MKTNQQKSKAKNGSGRTDNLLKQLHPTFSPLCTTKRNTSNPLERQNDSHKHRSVPRILCPPLISQRTSERTEERHEEADESGAG